mgnify:CR=1 FL=1
MTMPFLLLHGRDDRFVTFDSSIDLMKHLPNAQLHIFDRCGHWVQVEMRDKFCKLVKDFFNGEL